MGGTIAKYVEGGKKVIVIIFSYGEASLPHLQADYVKKTRLKEIKKVSSFLGTQETIFLGLPDANIKEFVNDKPTVLRVKKIILKYRPEKIFTHSPQDPHAPGDHKAVYQIVSKALDSTRKKYDLFAFEVWNITPENRPVMYIDISNHFKKKIKAMQLFKSQWFSILLTFVPVYLRAKKYGLKNNCRYAEKFYKLR
ncbi:PIG-L family deacetylase [Candidatus Woesearchaeota archaeon]|nr:PIG-L family deacetylase [Candidatus Woesearchaeota archaeon]